MTEEEHRDLYIKLYREWVGRTFVIEGEDCFTIRDVFVDYRKGREGRNMDRAIDDWGNIHFIFELEDALYLREVTNEERVI